MFVLQAFRIDCILDKISKKNPLVSEMSLLDVTGLPGAKQG